MQIKKVKVRKMKNNNHYKHQMQLAYEANAARPERTIKRLWILVIIMIAVTVFSNLGWLYYESQFEIVDETSIHSEQDGTGTNIVSGGDVHYGAEGYDN